MDAFALHPYEDNSSIPPSFRHPRSTTISIADYPKLVALLGKAFDGTAQAGASLPIVYDEFGVQSQIPAGKARMYQGAESPTAHAVAETTQGEYYAEAIAIAACQPTVAGIFIFHVSDESKLDRWQSGLYYADDSPKRSLSVVERAIASLHGGGVGPCTTSGARAFAARSASR